MATQTAYAQFPLLDNSDYWLRFEGEKFQLTDRRHPERLPFFFRSEVMRQCLIGDGTEWDTIRCGYIEDADEPFTVFFMVRGSTESGSVINKLRRFLPGDRETAVREFQSLPRSRMFELFGC